MAKREKSSRIYWDSLDNDVEILGSAQVSGAPGIFQSAASSSTIKRAASASSTRRHMYNYRDDSDAEYGKYEFIAYPLDDNDDKDLSDVKIVEKSKPKIQRRWVGKESKKGSSLPSRSNKRTSVISANKHQSQLSTTPERSTKRTSVISANKH